MKPSNKIIITGGSSGIGFDLLKNFLNLSYEVLCISRNKPKIKNKRLSFIKVDLSNKKNLINAKKSIIKFNTRYLICNAADLGEINFFVKANIKKWEESFFLNLFSHVYITKFCLKSLKKQKGAVFFLAGGGAASSFKKFSSYSLAKTAIVRFAENLAVENNNSIFSYAIAPGPVKTKLMIKTLKNGHEIKKGRIVTSEKCIDLINYLISFKKKFLNGKFIHVNDNYKKFTEKNSKKIYLLRRLENRNI
jgi:3-oxoacyl-[acyl-carrier protein] reductase